MSAAVLSRRAKRVERIAARDGWNCHYCGKLLRRMEPEQIVVGPDDATIDHVIPRSKGGTNRLDNLVLACAPCNQDKGDKVQGLGVEHLWGQPVWQKRRDSEAPRAAHKGSRTGMLKRYEDPMHEDVGVEPHWKEGQPWPKAPTSADIRAKNLANARALGR